MMGRLIPSRLIPSRLILLASRLRGCAAPPRPAPAGPGRQTASAGRAALMAMAAAMTMAVAVTVTVALSGARPAPAQELLLPPAPAAPAQQRSNPAADIADARAQLRELEGSFRDRGQSEAALIALRNRLAVLRDQLADRLGKLEPRLKALDQRAGQLATSAGANADEAPAVAAVRQRLAARRSAYESALQESRLLAAEMGSLDQRIHRRRREVFNNRLFARSASPLDAGFWNDLAASGAAEIAGLEAMASSFMTEAGANGGAGGALAAAAALAALGAAFSFAARWQRQFTARPTKRRFDDALTAVAGVLLSTFSVPALIAASVLTLRNFGVMTDPVARTAFALALALMAAGFGRGVAVGLFAPAAAGGRRIAAVGDREAASLAAHLIWASRLFGLSLLANEVHTILGASVTSFVATGELLAGGILAITAHQLWSTARARLEAQSAADADGAAAQHPWLRAAVWLCSVTIAAALAAGYVGFAVFVATRMLAAYVVSGAALILVTTIDAALTDLLAPGTPGRRSVAAALGFSQRGLDILVTLVSALSRLLIAALTLVLALNASGVFTDDVFSAMQHAVADYDIGAVHVSPVAILSALASAVVGWISVRAAQRWLATKLLPRTGLDAGLQNSISALSGYFLLIIVMAGSLDVLGIDLQKIALIAGALSVGIGFGLQAIVANFVSGLILLAERTVRVGDWVVVKNEEGFVRRISIRATEIETFDRASVIIPNQDFVTGMVKNWTHSSTVGRVIVHVRVAFDSDVAKVRALLLEAAVKHPQVLPGTPAVLVTGFGDIGIDLQLICLIGNVSPSPSVRSDLYLDILGKFRDARIKIPYPPHETSVPAVPSSQPASRMAS